LKNVEERGNHKGRTGTLYCAKTLTAFDLFSQSSLETQAITVNN